MSDESVPESKPAADIFSQSAVTSARKVMENRNYYKDVSVVWAIS